MRKIIISVVCVIVAIALISGAGVLYVVNTPEYALKEMVSGIEECGIDALLPNLTDDAYKKIEPIISIAENSVIQSIISLISDSDYASVLIEKAKDVKWTVGDVLKNNKKASVTIQFNYDEKITGSIDLELVKEEKDWKINDLYNLEIEKLS